MSSSNSDSASDSEEDNYEMDAFGGVEIFMSSVILPEFLLNHHEYTNTQVPQMKNFQVVTEKKHTGSRHKVKAKAFL